MDSFFGAGGESRTRLLGLGSPHSTDELHPHFSALFKMRTNFGKPKRTIFNLFLNIWRSDDWP